MGEQNNPRQRRGKRRGQMQERMERIMEFLRAYQLEHGGSPSTREIGHEIGVGSTSLVNNYLGKLEKQGRISIKQGIARGIQIKDWGDNRVGTGTVCHIPFAGRIVAGEPLPIPSGVSLDGECITVPRDSLHGDLRSVYALTVHGDSMIDALIADGDVVIVRYEPDVHDGDLVAAHVKDIDGFTLKRFHRHGNRVVLQPANPKYEPIKRHARDVEIQGKVILIVRQCEQNA